jgi:hypothetical protein
MMKVLCSLSLLAAAQAFAPQPAAFTTLTPNVGDRGIFQMEPATHRTRKATIVMDGKANGRFHEKKWTRCLRLVHFKNDVMSALVLDQDLHHAERKRSNVPIKRYMEGVRFSYFILSMPCC